MSRKPWSLVAVCLSLAVACGGSTKPAPAPVAPAEPIVVTPPLDEPAAPALPAIPKTPAAAPAGLIGTAQIGDPVALIAAVGGYADRIKPGAAAMLTLDTLVQGLAADGIDLRGADLTRPVRVLLLNPAEYQPPVVAVVAVGDEQALVTEAAAAGMRVQVHGGYAAIGSFDALSAAGGYALTTLASSTPPAQPTAEFDVAYLMATYGSLLEMVARQAVPSDPSQRATVEASIEMYVSLFRQIDRVTFSLEVAGDHASLVTRMHPLPGTALATFIGAQAPAKFTVLEQLADGPIAMGGRLDLQILWESMGTLFEPIMAATYGDAAPAIVAFWKGWAALRTGEHAFGVEVALGRIGASGVWEVDEPAAAAALWVSYLAKLSKVKPGGIAFKQSSGKHRGVKLSMLTATPTKDFPPDQRAAFDYLGGKLGFGLAVVDKRMLFTMGDAIGRAKALIDLSKDGPKPARTPAQIALAPVIAEAKRRGESYLVVVDLATLKATFAPASGKSPATEPAALAIGAEAGALVWRATVPAAQVKALADAP